MSRRLALVICAFAAVLGLSLGAISASAVAPKTTIYEVESELMCVTCGVPLEQSSATQANDERGEIERLIAKGLTKQQVIDEMVAIYGEEVLSDPPEKSLKVLRVVVPAAAGLLAAALFFVLLMRWRNRDPEPDSIA